MKSQLGLKKDFKKSSFSKYLGIVHNYLQARMYSHRQHGAQRILTDHLYEILPYHKDIQAVLPKLEINIGKGEIVNFTMEIRVR